MTTYKVFFHEGEELGLKTRVLKGTASLSATSLSVKGTSELAIPIGKISSVRLFRLHGLGRVIEVNHSHGRLFISVLRLMIGQFAFINFFKTGAFHSQLSNAIPTNEVTDESAK